MLLTYVLSAHLAISAAIAWIAVAYYRHPVISLGLVLFALISASLGGALLPYRIVLIPA